jgi:hypothetical protein
MSRIDYALVNIAEFRKAAAEKQAESEVTDTGMRSEVTGGGHLDALAEEISSVFVEAGIPREWIYDGKSNLELPGYFRAEKKWDIVVAHDSRLIAAIELKSIWGSYSNNLNNRAEEAIGSATDIARAIRSGLLGSSSPWLGYVFIIRDDEAIHRTTRFREPHFPVDDVFKGATYLKRFEVLCGRLVSERLYDNAWYVCLNSEADNYYEPNSDMTWNKFEAAIRGKVMEELA